jgi:PAS domain S-box-containing protein
MSISAILSEAILATQSDAIVAADQDGIICFWNPGAQRLFGYSSDEALGKTLDLIIPERLRDRHWDGYRRVMATGQSRYGTADVLSVPALRKDGATVSVEFTVALLQSEGRVIGIAAIMRDVSQRFEEIRALKRKLAELTKPTT